MQIRSRSAHRKCASTLFAAAAIVGLSNFAVHAAPILSDDFNTNTSANYKTFITGTTATGTSGAAATSGSPTGDVTFAYNYGAVTASGGLAIPVAPHTTDGTKLGLRIRTDNLANTTASAVVGATELVTKGLVLPSAYQVQVDVWSNYIGSGTSLATSGSNGSTGVVVGAGTSGNQLSYFAANDGMITSVIHDGEGGTNQDYRLYLDNNHVNPTTAGAYFAAGTGANSATHSDPYYTSKFPAVGAPADQVSHSATQGGTTLAGTPSFAWHTWTITENGTQMIWAIDGKTITTAPNSALTFGGSQVQLGADDTGDTGNTTAVNQLLNADIFDNLVITALPEPASLSFLGIAGLAMLRRRRQA